MNKYNPLLGLARNAKLRKMDMQCDPQWVLDMAAERDTLKADAERYRKLRDMNWYDGPLCVVRAPKGKVRPGTDCPSRERLDEVLDSL